MYDRGTPLNQFIEEFNQVVGIIEDFNTKYQGMVDQINFINTSILPRYSGRPAVFESITAMANSDVLVNGDICLTFNQGTEENSTKYIEAYKIELKSNRPNDAHVALKDTTLGAFIIPTSGEFEQVMGQINSVNADLTQFKNSKGVASGIAGLGADGKVPSAQLPEIVIPEYAPVTDTVNGLMKSTDYVDYKKLPIPTANMGIVTKNQGNNDFNSIMEAGLYYVNSNTNAPTTSTSWAVIVNNAGGLDNINYVQQIAINRDEHKKLYVRRKNSTTWSAWEVFNSFNDAMLNKLNSYDTLTSAKKNVYKELKNADFNTITEMGMYAVVNSTNAPTNYTNWGMVVTTTTSVDSNHVQQIAVAENNHQAIYVRRKNSTTWSAWEKFNAFTDYEKAKLAQYNALNNTNLNVYASKQASTNFNDYTTPGFYTMLGNTNKPDNSTSYSLIVSCPLDLTGDYVHQIAIAKDKTAVMYVREKSGTTWSAWISYNALSDILLAKLMEDKVLIELPELSYEALSEAEKLRDGVWYATYK